MNLGRVLPKTHPIMAHAPLLNIWAIGTMGSVVAIYAYLKSPLKYKHAAKHRLSPKADLAFRDGAQKWLDKQ